MSYHYRQRFINAPIPNPRRREAVKAWIINIVAALLAVGFSMWIIWQIICWLFPGSAQ